MFLEEVEEDFAVGVRRPLGRQLWVLALQIPLQLLVVVDLAVDGEGGVSVLLKRIENRTHYCSEIVVKEGSNSSKNYSEF